MGWSGLRGTTSLAATAKAVKHTADANTSSDQLLMTLFGGYAGSFPVDWPLFWRVEGSCSLGAFGSEIVQSLPPRGSFGGDASFIRSYALGVTGQVGWYFRDVVSVIALTGLELSGWKKRIDIWDSSTGQGSRDTESSVSPTWVIGLGVQRDVYGIGIGLQYTAHIGASPSITLRETGNGFTATYKNTEHRIMLRALIPLAQLWTQKK